MIRNFVFAVLSVFASLNVAAQSPQLINISTRGKVLTGNDVLIGGFVITGSAPKTVVVRASGPSLVPFGITNPLADPQIQLVRSSDRVLIASNDDWGTASNVSELVATGLAPNHPKEAAIHISLQPGAYTAIVSGVANTTGVGTVEVFAVDGAAPDTSPPQIASTAPTTASQNSTTFTLTYSDDVELAFRNDHFNGTINYWEEGVKIAEVAETVEVPLGGVYKHLFVAADTSGNVGKRTITIQSPPSGFKMGQFAVVGVPIIPPNFSCQPFSLPVPEVNRLILSVGPYTVVPQSFPQPPIEQQLGLWTATSGYRLRLFLGKSASNGFSNFASTSAGSPHPLTATTVELDAISQTSCCSPAMQIGYEGQIRSVPVSPARIEVDLRMKCNIANVLTYGQLMQFVAEAVE